MKINLTLTALSLIATFQLSAAEPTEPMRSDSEKKGALATARMEDQLAEAKRSLAEAKRSKDAKRINAHIAAYAQLLGKSELDPNMQKAMLRRLQSDENMQRGLLMLTDSEGQEYLREMVNEQQGRQAAIQAAKQSELDAKHEAERKEEIASDAPAASPAKSSAAGEVEFATQPKPGAEASRRAYAKMSKRIGKGSLAQLPAAAMHKIAEFVGPATKRLVRTHQYQNMPNFSATVLELFMTLHNPALLNFIGPDVFMTLSATNPAYQPMKFSYQPMFTGYEFIPLHYAAETAPSVNSRLRVHNGSFYIKQHVGYEHVIVDGIKKTSEQLRDAIGRSKNMGMQFNGDGVQICALQPSVNGRPGDCLLRHPRRVTINDATGHELISIPDTATLSLLPLGFSKRPHEIIAWNMLTDSFGYYTTDTKQFSPLREIPDPLEYYGVPPYSLKPYSTLCIIHDDGEALTIFDPRLPNMYVEWALPHLDLFECRALGLGLKWNDRDQLINILLILNDGTANIYKVVNDTPDFARIATEPAPTVLAFPDEPLPEIAPQEESPKLIKRLKGG